MIRSMAIAVCVLGMAAAAVQAAPVMPDAEGLVAYYLFDEASGTTVLDGKGYAGNNGTMVGDTIARVATTPFSYTGNTAMSFDAGGSTAGDDDYVAIPVTTNTLDFRANGTYSLSVWFKTTSTGVLMARAMASPQYNIVVRGSAPVGAVQANIGKTGVYTSTAYNNGAWHNVVVSMSGSAGKMYVDGVDTLLAVEGGTYKETIDTLIGARRGANNSGSALAYTGLIDEVAFFNYALSGNEAAWLAGHSLATLPEPATLCLLAFGGALVVYRRRYQS